MTQQPTLFDQPPVAAEENFLETLHLLQQQLRISPITRYFTGFLAERFGEKRPIVLKAVALAMHKNMQGDVGVDLRSNPKSEHLFTDYTSSRHDEDVDICGEDDWASKISDSPVLSDGTSPTPLVLDSGRLYIRKMWVYETQLADAIKRKANQLQNIDAKTTAEIINRLFDLQPNTTDWQAVACVNSAISNFSVITGGPGTGKTYTVLRLLALLIELQQKSGNGDIPRIALAAPTGKAAARVTESISRDVEGLRTTDAVRLAIPQQAKTLHRLLGYKHNSPEFRHNQDNPLPYDVVVTDEASMIDLAMMNRLINAVRPDAKLILIGDKDQLASVEAGAVLGDICAAPGDELNRFTGENINRLHHCGLHTDTIAAAQNGSSLSNCITELRVSRRFRENTGIARLATAVNLQQADEVRTLLNDANYSELKAVPHKNRNAEIRAYGEFLKVLQEKDLNPQQAFQHLEKKQILCAHRRGNLGTQQLNSVLEKYIRPAYGSYSRGEWFPGRVIMITENDYHNNLFNGDIGITLLNRKKDRLEVWFRTSSDSGTGFDSFTTAQLGGFESACAISVHKSQGSEYEEVIFVLPEKSSPVLTKELCYTALTRARKRFTIIGDQHIIAETVKETISRSSGLTEKLQH